MTTSPSDLTSTADALGIPAHAIPRHVAIIMDGNGRWAQARNQPRIMGHQAGARAVRDVVTASGQLGIEALTLYSFSIENWKRPADEVDALMSLLTEYLIKERDELLRSNVRFVQVGRREGLPDSVLAGIDDMTEATSGCTGLTLALAVNYGSRAEITDAVRTIASRIKSGTLQPDDIDEALISDHLYTAGLPDPDLLIRTAGQMRISNYLLWQISYAELYVTDAFWPDFSIEQFHAAICDFAARDRRFGGLKDATDAPD